MSSVKKPYFHVLIVLPANKGGMKRLFDDCPVGEVIDKRVIVELFYSHDDRAGAVLRFPRRLVQFIRKVRTKRYDLCHINLTIKGSTVRKCILALICRTFGIRYIIHLHGGRYREFYRQQPVFCKHLVQRLFLCAERVVVLGNIWREFVVSEIGVHWSSTVVLQNAVMGPRETCVKPHTTTSGPAPQILFLGRICEGKGAVELAAALKSLQLSRLQWTAVIAGEGDIDLFANEMTEAGLESRVKLPGWVGADDVCSYLKQSAIFVLPSHAENLPLSLLEGMAYGLCPVVTPVGAVPEVICHGVNGLMVPVGDADALAHALAKMIEMPDLRAQLAAQAQLDWKARYNRLDYWKRLESIYLSVLEDRSSVAVSNAPTSPGE